MDFTGKNVAITGGAGGLGHKIIRQLLLNGVQNVGIMDLSDPNNIVQLLRTEFPHKGIEFIRIDVRDVGEVKKSFQMFINFFKQLDIFIGGAGLLNEVNYENAIAVNLLGLINTNKEAIEHISIENNGKGGIIANISSIAGILYTPLCPIYNATKHGVLAFTKSMASKYYNKKYGINFMTVCPGVTDTPFWDNLDSHIPDDFRKIFMDRLKLRGFQTSDQLATKFVEVLAKNQNDSIWIIENGKIKEHVIPPSML